MSKKAIKFYMLFFSKKGILFQQNHLDLYHMGLAMAYQHKSMQHFVNFSIHLQTQAHHPNDLRYVINIHQPAPFCCQKSSNSIYPLVWYKSPNKNCFGRVTSQITANFYASTSKKTGCRMSTQ